MALPVGVTTCTVTFGKVLTPTGVEGRIEGTVTMDRKIVHAATGWSINPANEKVTPAGSGGQLSFELPAVDQPGFIDQSGAGIENWSYTLVGNAIFGSQTLPFKKTFQVFVGQSTLDLDLVPDGPATDPVSTPASWVVDAQTARDAAADSAAAAAMSETNASGHAAAALDSAADAATDADLAEAAREEAESFATGFTAGDLTLLPVGADPTLDITGPAGSKVLDLGIPAPAADDASMEAVRANPASAFAQGLSATIDAHVPAASTSTQGKVELATTTETTTGTDTARAITPAGLKAAVDPIVASTPTLDEVQHSNVLDTGSVSAARTQVILTSLYASRLEQASLVVRTAVAASDTNYWTIELLRYRSGFATVIATKTTKTTASGGEAMGAYFDWNFNATTFGLGRYLDAGDVVAIRLTPTGTPTALDGPTITFRTSPTDGGIVDGIVYDSFNRADSATSLGVSDSGHAWSVLSGVWGISTSRAYAPTFAGPQTIAVIDTGKADAVIDVRFGTVSGSMGLAFRMTDATNGFVTNATGLFKFESGSLDASTNFAATFIEGDTMRVVCSGTTITVYRQAGSTGPFVQMAQRTGQTFNQAATKHGLRSSVSGSRLDDFRVAA